MLIAIEGCLHGELTAVYETLMAAPERPQLLLCCGDFQSIRNEADLNCLSVPRKYAALGDFHRYYSGERKAPILTIFIGGNHEASNFLQELPYGGWVAHNIFYLGYAGVVNIGGLRIGGVSGIYKSRDFKRGRFEFPPYTEDTKRSVYHYRNLEMFRLKQLSGKLDIFLSHDWPSEITQYGNSSALLQKKPYFEEDIRSGKLGSPPLKDLLEHMKPKFWFAGHLHCYFPALVSHKNSDSMTRFLALDKCLPHRKFLQILNFPHDEKAGMELRYDLEWLTILRLTNNLLSVRPIYSYMPEKKSIDRWNFTPTEDEKRATMDKMQDNLLVPIDFEMTSVSAGTRGEQEDVSPVSNPQTVRLCDCLQLDDPVGVIVLQKGKAMRSFSCTANTSTTSANEEINLESPENSPSRTSTITEATASVSLSSTRSSMSLPKPVHYVDYPENETTLSTSMEAEVSDSLETSVSETPPTQKKAFKRRNESLYKSNSDDC